MCQQGEHIKATTHICKHDTSFSDSYASYSFLLRFQYSTFCVIAQINTTYRMSFVAFHFHNTDYAFVYLFTSLTLHFSYIIIIQMSAHRSIYRLHYYCHVFFITVSYYSNHFIKLMISISKFDNIQCMFC